jgi:Carboxypeptidase regulatory-like domain
VIRSCKLGVITAAFLSAVAAQQQGATRASLSGTVTNLAGEPLKNATIELVPQSGNSTPQSYSVSSDTQGNFSFDAVELGRYIIRAGKIGYVGMGNSTTLNGPSTVFDLISQHAITGVKLTLTPRGIISGKVTDEDGDPRENIRVYLQRWGYERGRRRLIFSDTAYSNAEGDFALGVAPGSYLIYAQVQQPPRMPLESPKKGPQEAYVSTYYPGVTDSSSAASIQVSAGAAVRGVEIRLRKARAYQISGKAAGPGADGDRPVSLQLSPQGSSDLGESQSSQLDGGGKFLFDRVLPGRYVLESMQINYGDGRQSTPAIGRQVIEVSDSDVGDVVLQLGPGAEIAGTVVFDGFDTPPTTNQLENLLIELVDPDSNSSRDVAHVDQDARFRMHHVVPKLYRVEAYGLPSGSYVKTIRFGNQDVTKSLLDLTSGSGGALEVALARGAGDIGGILRGADGSPLSNIEVSLWRPGIPSREGIDFARATKTDSTGQFAFQGLSPGEYRVAAWQQIDFGLGTVPEFQTQFEDQATAVKLNENDHAQIQPALIPRAAIEAAAAKLQ